MDQSLFELGKLTATIATVWYLLKRNMDKTDKLDREVGILQEKAKDISQDHDKLVVIGVKVEETEKDLNAAHIKIRDLERA